VPHMSSGCRSEASTQVIRNASLLATISHVGLLANSVGAFHAGILTNFVVVTQLLNGCEILESPCQIPLPTTFRRSGHRKLESSARPPPSRHDGGGRHRLTDTSFQNDASKEERDATVA
jgi:hypothetical protein